VLPALQPGTCHLGRNKEAKKVNRKSKEALQCQKKTFSIQQEAFKNMNVSSKCLQAPYDISLHAGIVNKTLMLSLLYPLQYESYRNCCGKNNKFLSSWLKVRAIKMTLSWWHVYMFVSTSAETHSKD
jgi:hypothetical protein